MAKGHLNKLRYVVGLPKIDVPTGYSQPKFNVTKAQLLVSQFHNNQRNTTVIDLEPRIESATIEVFADHEVTLVTVYHIEGVIDGKEVTEVLKSQPRVFTPRTPSQFFVSMGDPSIELIGAIEDKKTAEPEDGIHEPEDEAETPAAQEARDLAELNA